MILLISLPVQVFIKTIFVHKDVWRRSNDHISSQKYQIHDVGKQCRVVYMSTISVPFMAQKTDDKWMAKQLLTLRFNLNNFL